MCDEYAWHILAGSMTVNEPNRVHKICDMRCSTGSEEDKSMQVKRPLFSWDNSNGLKSRNVPSVSKQQQCLNRNSPSKGAACIVCCMHL